MGIVSQIVQESIGSLLYQCSKAKAFRHGISLHAAVVKMGMLSDVIVSNHLINMYAKCGKISLSRKVFDEMSETNLVSWSALISGYDQAGEPRTAIDLFSKMELVPNEYVLASAISACANLLALTQGQQIHAQSVKSGYCSISFVSNSLISMYMKCGQCSDSLSVFGSASELNSVSYNALITGLIENQQPEKGLEIFKQMRQLGLVPDRFTFAGVLGVCSTADDLRIGMGLHCQTIKLKLDSTPFVGNIILTVYSKFNMMEEAERAFCLIEEKDTISWNTLIAACSHFADHAKGLRIFQEMVNIVSLQPDDFTYTSALVACAGIASVVHGKQIHAHLIRRKLDVDVGVGNALVNMYAKCGCIGYAYTVFSQMSHLNLVSWNTIIAGFGNHGYALKAIELFEQMKETGLEPDSVTFIALLTACNHAGLANEGQLYFNSMDEIYKIAPDVEHFSCLIDMLGRAGRLEEAQEYMKKFPFGHDPVVLGSLLSACRLHGDVSIGEHLAKEILKLQPNTSSPYVLLSNLYALDGIWDGVAEARKMLKGSGLKKEPGHSLIEVKGIVEKFKIGDFSHSRIQEIVQTLKTLGWEVDEVLSYC
ncbi:pentatricopeptide repeat-containing protein At3g57430, chloroplastic-like [Diospyros lotus]|uniref:pentatricopeptide repeat-containing protein At3g57430, chloroplastic-like n=1 Tax=Diospyros lotus TaxID=55363 RepID=UPI0022552D22|nr:pentatricopeptide repeat-containing protein At3g57430, chloroplastic-like [Diospyros lotus]